VESRWSTAVKDYLRLDGEVDRVSKIILRRHEAFGNDEPFIHSALARFKRLLMVHTPDLRHNRKVTSVT